MIVTPTTSTTMTPMTTTTTITMMMIMMAKTIATSIKALAVNHYGSPLGWSQIWSHMVVDLLDAHLLTGKDLTDVDLSRARGHQILLQQVRVMA